MELTELFPSTTNNHSNDDHILNDTSNNDEVDSSMIEDYDHSTSNSNTEQLEEQLIADQQLRRYGARQGWILKYLDFTSVNTA